MAIDTAAKRSQMLGFGSGDTLPIPDGTIAQADRQHLLWLYGGIAAAGLVTGPVCWAAGEVYLPGFQKGEEYLPGFQAGEKEC